jgi:hypothetical protein
VVVVSSSNALPPALVVTDPTVLKSDNSGPGAALHVSARMTLNAALMTSNSPCPLPFTSSTGMLYCDGFNAKDSAGHTVVVDTFAFLGSNPPCKSTLPVNGNSLSTISGIWQDSYNATSMVDTWTLALSACSDVGQGTAYSGTGTPPMTTEISVLRLAFPTTPTMVTVKGVVTATWSASPAFGFTIQDPAGGNNSALPVSRGKASTSTAVAPHVGDYVTVTGTTKTGGTAFKEIDL